MFEIGRVMGMSVARVAEAVLGVVGEAMIRPGDTERDVAERMTATAEWLAPLAGPTLAYAFNLHQLEQVRRQVLDQEQIATGAADATEVAVCFADLVEFTKLGEQLAPDELGKVVGRLGEIARQAAAPPVSLIKLIGDAAMLVSTDAPALLHAALDLVEAADREGEGFPLLRAGVAYGPALARGGDWYGRPVNMASRITDVARPGSVLCSEGVTDAVEDGGYRWSFAGERHLKGLSGQVRLFRARRSEPSDADPSA